jgi:hypothetical protein
MSAQDKPFIMILVKRAAILMLVICSVSIFYWIIGSGASFLDATQAMLLGIMRISSLALIAASGLGLIVAIASALARRFRLGAAGLAGYALAAAFGAFALLLAQGVSVLSQGLR